MLLIYIYVRTYVRIGILFTKYKFTEYQLENKRNGRK